MASVVTKSSIWRWLRGWLVFSELLQGDLFQRLEIQFPRPKNWNGLNLNKVILSGKKEFREPVGHDFFKESGNGGFVESMGAPLVALLLFRPEWR